MAIQTIGYANKVTLNENTDVADINKVKADDMNEIKSVVNNNASELEAAIIPINGLLYVRKTTDQYIPANNEQGILYDSVITNQGNCFSYSSGGATVLTDDVKAVTVTASVFNKGWGNLDGAIRIYKNNEIMASTFFNKSNEQVVAQFAVQKNDVIRATVTSNNAVTISNSNNISFLSIKS